MMITATDIDRLTRLLRTVAADEILPRLRQTNVSADHKPDGSLVTTTDRAVQERITVALAQDYPGIALLGEEMESNEQRRILNAHDTGVWVLDPIDGTSNFVNGFPGFGISLALVANGQPQAGLVYDPLREECFAAIAGAGATLNGQPIRPYASAERLDECLAMIDPKRLSSGSLVRLFGHGGFRSQRNLGSAALEWCWLAAGRFQVYLHGGQKLWDFAAGRLIASEAGAAWQQYRTDDYDAAPQLDLDPRLNVAAANAPLLNAWLEFVDLPALRAGT